jgi:glycogen synthase
MNVHEIFIIFDPCKRFFRIYNESVGSLVEPNLTRGGTNNLKVLMFGWEFPPLITGGLGVACHGITRGLAQLGTQITLVVPRYIDRSPKFIKLVSADKILSKLQDGQEIDLSEIIPLISAYINPEDYEDWYKKAFSSSASHKLLYGPDLFYEMERFALAGSIIASKAKFDVIHCHDWMTTKAAIVAKKVSGAPMVMHVHSIENDRSVYCNPQVFEVEKQGLEAADCILCVSHYTMERVHKIYGIPKSKMAVVHNGIDLKKCALPRVNMSRKRTKQGLFLGRITWQKGPDYFVDSARIMLEKRSDLRFVLAGWGDKAIPLIDRIAKWHLGSKILFAGFLNESDVKRLFRASDLFLMPSISEPFGLVALEALSNGVPAVLSKQSGVSEVLDSVPNADYWDTEKFAQFGLQILDNPLKSQQMLDEIWPKIEHMNWERNGKLILKHYQKLISRQ